MKYQAIIFDWDGTLMDSAQRIVESMELAAVDVGLDVRTPYEIRQIIGLGLPEAIIDLWNDLEADPLTVEEMRARYNHHYLAEERAAMPFYNYALDMLDNLRTEGFQLAVATGKSRKGLDRIFAEREVGHFFHDSRCADETKSKPHPLMLEELSKSLNIEPENLLMVGDTQWDLDMANNAGIDAVGISHGAHAKEKLLRSKPKTLVDDLNELHDWIREQVV